MNLAVLPMDRDGAVAISRWTYDSPYDFYNVDSDEAIDEFLNGTYFKILVDGNLIGFCCFGHSAIVPTGLQQCAYPENGAVDIGLGMRPDLTGGGRGHAFVSSILDFAQSRNETDLFRMTVATFNKRAIKLYKNLGFEPVLVFSARDVEFLTMLRRPAKQGGDE